MQNIDDVFQEAFTCHNNGNIEDAKKGYEKVLAVSPEHPSALHLLGLINFDRDNNSEEALRLIKKSIELSPNEFIWLFNYGKILSENDQFEMSISVFQKALSINPESYEVRTALADLYYKTEQFREALKLYYKILCDNPGDSEIGMKYVSTMEKKKKKREAENFLAWFYQSINLKE